MTAHCPECGAVVQVKSGAREGRCMECRPLPRDEAKVLQRRLERQQRRRWER